MNPVIYDMPSVQATLIMQISLELLINVRDDGFKTVKQIWIQEIMANNFSDASKVIRKHQDILLMNQPADGQKLT